MERMQLSPDQLAARDILSKLSDGNRPPESIEMQMSLLNDLGIESLQFIRLVLEIEEAVSRKVFDVESLSKMTTVADLYSVLQTSEGKG